MEATATHLEPSRRVTVVQQIPQRSRVWTIRVTGTVVRYEQAKTGSWYAHAKDDRLWLDRLVLRKDDGEIIVCNLDKYTCIEVEPEPEPEPVESAAAATDEGGSAEAESGADATNGEFGEAEK